jgi:hypothetical protein
MHAFNHKRIRQSHEVTQIRNVVLRSPRQSPPILQDSPNLNPLVPKLDMAQFNSRTSQNPKLLGSTEKLGSAG